MPRDGSLNAVAEIGLRMTGCQFAVIGIVDHEGLFALADGDAPTGEQPARFTSLASRDRPSPAEAEAACRAAADPAAINELGFGFYAGVPLHTADGHLLGTLAILDPNPRPAEQDELALLRLLADVIVSLLELRIAAQVAVAEIRLGSD